MSKFQANFFLYTNLSCDKIRRAELSLGQIFVWHAHQNDVFFTTGSWEKEIILASMTNKYSALLIMLGLYFELFLVLSSLQNSDIQSQFITSKIIQIFQFHSLRILK